VPRKTPIDLVRAIVPRGIPHAGALGCELVSVEKGRAVVRLPWREEFVGNPETRAPSGGVITTLIDTAAGMAAMAALDEMVPIATLDLRIEYLKPAAEGRTIEAAAECHKVTRTIAFVRAWAYQDGRDDPVATASGTFMLDSSDAVLRPPPKKRP